MIDFYGVHDVYSDSGVDLTLLRQNLQRTVEDRWEDNRRFWQQVNGVPSFSVKTGRVMKTAPFNPTAILEELLNQQVEFVVIGGLAMLAHGSSYLTRDLDVCYARIPAANLEA